MALSWNHKHHKRMIRKYGFARVWFGLITMPLWLPLFFLLRGVSFVCIRIGEFGYWLSGR